MWIEPHAIPESHPFCERSKSLILAANSSALSEFVRERDSSGRTPLHIASALGECEVVTALLQNGAETDSRDGAPADRNRFARRFRELGPQLYAGALRRGSILASYSPLMEAAQHGHLPVVKVLVESGADPDAQDLRGYTPLKIAVEEDEGEIVRWLVSNGANPDIPDVDREPPLAACVRLASDRLFELLLHRTKKKHSLSRALAQAVQSKRLDFVEALLEAGADPNSRALGPSAGSVLCRAIYFGDVSIATMLLDHGADPNRLGLNGSSPLCSAVEFAESSEHGIELVELLLNRGADPDRDQKNGATPAVIAIGKCGAKIFELLLQAGIDRGQRVAWHLAEPRPLTLKQWANSRLEWWTRQLDSEFSDDREEARRRIEGANRILGLLERADQAEP